MLELSDIHGGYGRIQILNGTSFSIPAGSITTMIGPVLLKPRLARF